MREPIEELEHQVELLSRFSTCIFDVDGDADEGIYALDEQDQNTYLAARCLVESGRFQIQNLILKLKKK